jgi:Type VI secretion system (T6SS), amidase effector protein 4
MPTFAHVWDNYPASEACLLRNKAGNLLYENQCAIKLGHALATSGVSFSKFRGSRCDRAAKDASHAGHIRMAQELANWLKTKPFKDLGATQKFKAKTGFEEIKNRTGIIFLANYWQRASEKGTAARSGDHIDLWIGSRMTAWSESISESPGMDSGPTIAPRANCYSGNSSEQWTGGCW